METNNKLTVRGDLSADREKYLNDRAKLLEDYNDLFDRHVNYKKIACAKGYRCDGCNMKNRIFTYSKKEIISRDFY